jgi:hypothetical protein
MGDFGLADGILIGIEDQPFMSSGFTLVSGMIKAFGICPHFGNFLDKRLIRSPHLSGSGLERRAIKIGK